MLFSAAIISPYNAGISATIYSTCDVVSASVTYMTLSATNTSPCIHLLSTSVLSHCYVRYEYYSVIVMTSSGCCEFTTGQKDIIVSCVGWYNFRKRFDTLKSDQAFHILIGLHFCLYIDSSFQNLHTIFLMQPLFYRRNFASLSLLYGDCVDEVHSLVSLFQIFTASARYNTSMELNHRHFPRISKKKVQLSQHLPENCHFSNRLPRECFHE